MGFRGHVATMPCRDIVELERALYAKSIMNAFTDQVDEWRAEHPGQRPKLLDSGGRARSGISHSDQFAEHCGVTVTDIIVDVVADVHRMSEAPGEHQFDFAMCVSVFEHLLMPWKAALEINKVLKPGGVIVMQTHQTVGMHDAPWDYYRFSDESWKGLLNHQTGFEIETTLMSCFQHVVPIHHYSVYPGFENAGGFNDSAVIARKIGDSAMEWPVPLTTVISSMYPE